MELYETIEGMTSTDYRERFKAEYRQTKIRYEKLKDFCNRIEAAARTARTRAKAKRARRPRSPARRSGGRRSGR